jgi:hypothetical protein
MEVSPTDTVTPTGERRAEPGLTRGSEQSTWEERVDPWKMSGTPIQNPLKTMGSQGWCKVEKWKVEDIHIEISLLKMPGGE